MEPTSDYDYATFDLSLRSGYIDSNVDSDSRFDPRFVANSATTGVNLLSVLKRQLADCESFDFSVAFIEASGLQTLIETLAVLRERHIPGRLLTSTYLNFNSPEVLGKLLEFDNIEVRVYQGNMHAKGYFFNRGALSTVIVGSSNLTQSALTCNKEWNVLFHSFPGGEMLKAVRSEFEGLWQSDETVSLTSEWLQQYRSFYAGKGVAEKRDRGRAFVAPTGTGAPRGQAGDIVPNEMQARALEALAVLHERGERRALLVSATGTGKTYLAALEVASTRPRRVLFIAHRQRILDASMRSFKRVLGDSYVYEWFKPGGHGSLEATSEHQPTCTFAMIGTLANHVDELSADAFDYIIIDEAHRSGAGSYRKVMEHLVPRFYLGMTATPERTDGYDVYALFNHVIAYRITLQDALTSDMLVPFHYFGIADLEVDDQTVDDPSLFAKLTSDERVRHVTEAIELYSICREGRRGLIFCNRNDEASRLSAKFNALGYRTLAISGATSDAERNQAIERLERGDLEYLFSVDIMNEGVDIPSLNQIIMLRRTESPIVFIQQLGRGLRKDAGKDYVLVLDFIGNYQRNYLVPIALSGDRTYNKDGLRAFVKEGSTIIPGASTVTFDRVSEARIFRAIDGGKFNAVRLMRDEYAHLKQTLGRIPALADFDANEAIDPLIIFSKYGSYHGFLKSCDPDYQVSFSEDEESVLRHLSQKMAAGKRLEDLELVRELVAALPEEGAPASTGLAVVSRAALRASIGELITRVPDDMRLDSVVRQLDGTFSGKAGVPLVERDGTGFRLTERFSQLLQDAEFRRQVTEVIDFGLSRNRRDFAQPYGDTSFVLYAKYTYEEVCCLLGWEKNVNGQNIGGYKYDRATNTFPVFINYDKDPSISDSIKYEDRFISERELIAISKQPRHLGSPEIERLKAWPGNGMRIYLFVRKNKKDEGSKEFYFLGEMFPTGRFAPIVMPGAEKPAVEIGYRLDVPVRSDLYDYLTGDFADDENEGELA